MTSEERDQLVEEKKREMSRERDERRARTASEDLDPLGIKVKHAQEESHAAKQIQATFRGNRDRKEVKARKESKERKRGMSVIAGSAVVDRRKQSKPPLQTTTEKRDGRRKNTCLEHHVLQ